MESAYPSPETEARMVGDDKVPYDVMSPEQLLKKAAKLEKQMLKAARDLEFEEAARLRDEIHRIRDFGLAMIKKPAEALRNTSGFSILRAPPTGSECSV